jgi:hypothetical protein
MQRSASVWEEIAAYSEKHMKHKGTMQRYECKNQTENNISAIKRVEKTN